MPQLSSLDFSSQLPGVNGLASVADSASTEVAASQRQHVLTSQRTNTLTGVQILGTGSFVPENIVSNEELNKRFGFDPNWIRERTGILERRHAPIHMSSLEMGAAAAERAIRAAGVNSKEIDLLIVGTFTPDYQCPSTACLLQNRLGLDCAAFDLAAACAGFMYSLVTASQFIATGNAKVALVIGVDCMSRIINPKDQRTYPLFGDGAGAAIITAGDSAQGLVCYQMGSDGSGGDLLDRPAGGSRCPITADAILAGDQYLRMDGRSVFKWAVRLVQDSIELVLEKSGHRVEDVRLFLLHQANIRIIDAAMENLSISEDRVFCNVQKYGNTSAASVPLVLDEALRAGRIQRGDLILLCGFGAGLSWGTGLFRW